jgi:CRISPR/Cas system-associated protein Cas7 (RAMP superfamily)
MLLSEVRKTIIEKKPWWIEEASDEVLTLRNMFSAVQGYKLDFSPITHCSDILYMYNNTKFKYPDNPKYQDEIDRINEILEHRHIKNSRNILCSIVENCVEGANGTGIFGNFKVSVRNIAYNNIQDKMWGYLGN